MFEQREAVCSVCGKKFFIASKSQYLYKVKEKYQCSYSCYKSERMKIKDVRKII
jgi:hypothetical protein